MWCLATSGGYLLRFHPYTGAGDREEGVSLGSSVTRKLSQDFLPPESFLYVDNFFNSLGLLESLKEQNISCIGTIRQDRIEKAPLKDLKKEARGSSQIICNKGKHVFNFGTLAR